VKVSLVVDGKAYACKLPHSTSSFADVSGWTCECGGTQVRGGGVEHHDHDTYYANAHCTKCSKPVGKLTAKVDTLFGIDEDELVLHGRPRVY
jgi:hypothetical protein